MNKLTKDEISLKLLENAYIIFTTAENIYMPKSIKFMKPKIVTKNQLIKSLFHIMQIKKILKIK